MGLQAGTFSPLRCQNLVQGGPFARGHPGSVRGTNPMRGRLAVLLLAASAAVVSALPICDECDKELTNLAKQESLVQVASTSLSLPACSCTKGTQRWTRRPSTHLPAPGRLTPALCNAVATARSG